MPRRRWSHFKNSFYHVILRGNYRQKIFFGDKDRYMFFDTLEKVVTQFDCRIHLFCLMTNHIHLVIEVTHIPLWKIMQTLGSVYAKKCNKRLNRNGHLFEGRYKAELIQNDKYLLELCYYIHRNPVKANIVRNIDDYRWSSHHAYCGTSCQEWLSTQHISNLLATYIKSDNDFYLNFMLDREQHYRTPTFCRFSESGDLIIHDSVNHRRQKGQILNLANIPLQHINEIICDSLQIPLDELDSPSQARKVTMARSLITYFAHYHAMYSIKDIALLFSREPDSVSRTMHRFLRNMHSDKALLKSLERLEIKLSISYKDRLKN